jgi:hypothetical protein
LTITEIKAAVWEAYETAPTDIEILGEALIPSDAGSETLQGKVTYAWYYSIARILLPDVIAEIGVRYGYSGLSMKRGAQPLGDEPVLLYGFDNQSYGVESNESIAVKKGYTAIFTLDTQTVTEFAELEGFAVDLFHVDGDHSYAGTEHDLGLAVKSGAKYILVDDITNTDLPEVLRATDEFCRLNALACVDFPTFRGLRLIQV